MRSSLRFSRARPFRAGTLQAKASRRSCRAGGALLEALLLASCALVTSCGGAPASEARSPGPAATAESTSTSSSEEAATYEAPAARCDDGTCFECGEGFCPQGFYCDRDAEGGPACSWVPDCAKKPSCSCLTKTLGKSCSCDDSGVGPSVTCR